MCGRYSLYDYKMTEEEFESRFGFPISQAIEFPPSYNIGPYREVPVILSDRDNRSFMRMAQWQLVPSFAKTFASQYAMFNTREDSFDKKPFWRKQLQYSRCIFPANNFFEWARRNGQKYPYAFEKGSGELLSIGGIYSVWQDPEGAARFSASMITVDANAVVETVHPRMPFILPEDAERRWLDRKATDFAELRALLRPYPGEHMQSARVSQKVNNIRNEGPQLLTLDGE